MLAGLFTCSLEARPTGPRPLGGALVETFAFPFEALVFGGRYGWYLSLWRSVCRLWCPGDLSGSRVAAGLEGLLVEGHGSLPQRLAVVEERVHGGGAVGVDPHPEPLFFAGLEFLSGPEGPFSFCEDCLLKFLQLCQEIAALFVVELALEVEVCCVFAVCTAVAFAFGVGAAFVPCDIEVAARSARGVPLLRGRALVLPCVPAPWAG